jgi:hypothetical protein
VINYLIKLKPSTGGKMPPKENYMFKNQLSNFSKNLVKFVPENANDVSVIDSIENVTRDHLENAYINLVDSRTLEKSDLDECKKLIKKGFASKDQHKENITKADIISLKNSIDHSYRILKSIRKLYASLFYQDIEEKVTEKFK